MNSNVLWNFQKYLIDENGKLAGMVKPTVRPDSEKIVNRIKE
jgi:glutathione peroxidase